MPADGEGAAKPKSELMLRIVSALVLAPIALGATWWGGAVFAALAVVTAVLILAEWTDIVGDGGLAVLVVASAVAVAATGLSLFDHPDFGAGLVLVAAAVALALGRRWLAAGLVYAGFAAVALVAVRGTGPIGLVAILAVFAVVWGTDIAAYFTGRALGGPKLWPRVSPKKTWSGAIGGLVAGVAAAVGVVAAARGLGVIPAGSSLVAFAAVAALLSVASQAGDLFESHVKRLFGRKDSGTLIPGHGGIMDRVDGLVFAGIVAAFVGYLAAAGGDPGVGLVVW